MTSPTEQEQQALNELVVALAYAQTFDVAVGVLKAAPGISQLGVELLLEIPQVRSLVRLSPKSGAHAAVLSMNRLNLIRRASYLLAAARRMTTAARLDSADRARALVTERRYLQQHLQASAQRQVAASQVAATARTQQRGGSTWDGLLGWYAVMDSVTSAECRRAHRRNFDPRMVPLIGFPGAVHPSCRCRPGPPWPDGDRVEDLTASRDSSQPVGPRRVTLEA